MLSHLMLLQNQIKKKLQIKYSKVDVLITYWDKVINELVHKSEEFGDNHMIELINKIILVPNEVRIYVLRAYLR